ncbi:MAG: hypothetical protein WA840_03005 [Caulobacteraceae bacterium]
MNRSLAIAAVAWLLLGAAAVPARPAADDDPPTAVQTATYTVQVEHGQVRSLEIHPKAGGRLVADRFVNDAQSRKEEARDLPYEFCQTAACRSTCNYAQLTRPIRRLSRYDANGRLVWRWQGQGAGAIGLIAHRDADCLSPDGRYLTVLMYELEDDDTYGAFTQLLGPAVLDLHGPRFVGARGLGSNKDLVIGWKPDAPSILIVDEGGADSDHPHYRYSHPRP